MRRILYSLTLITTLLPFAGKAQEVTSMSLDQAVEYALIHQAKMKNAILDQRSTDAKTKEVTGLALPSLKATGGINYAPLVAAFEVPNFIKGAIVGSGNNDGLVNNNALNQDVVNGMPNTLSLAFQPKWTTTGQLEASQILFDPSVMIALQARKKLIELSKKSVELTKEQVELAVTKAYYDILLAEKRKELLDQNVKRIGQLEGETREIYKNGLAEKVDVDRLTVALNNLKTEQLRVGQLIEIAYMALKFQMGMPLEQSLALTDRLTEDNLNQEIVTHTLDFDKRKEYQLLTLQKHLNTYDLRRYKLGGVPTLVAFANYGYTLYNSGKLFDPVDKWQKSALIGTKLTVPLFDGFQRRNKVKQSMFTLEKTENDIENLKYALELETESARITMRSNLLALENQRANMQLAEEVYNITQIKYKEGVGSSIEVITAESALKEAQTNYFTALYDATTARINLLKALGEL
jgi:outer membrane protein TolC